MKHFESLHLLALVLGLSLTSCGSGELPLADVDAAAAPTNPTFAQVFSIIERECLPCHSGSVEPNLDGCQNLLSNLGGVQEEALDTNAMPPGAWPRLNGKERLTIQRWINNGAPATCP